MNSIYFNLLILSFNPSIPEFPNSALININSVQKINSFLELMTRCESMITLFFIDNYQRLPYSAFEP